MHAHPQAEAMLHAYQRLMQLNMESWKPEVADWLHSEEASQELRDLLIAVPCAPVIN